MKVFLLPFIFVYRIFSSNVGKILTLLLFVISIYSLKFFPKEKQYLDVISGPVEYGGEVLYITENDKHKAQLSDFDFPQIVKNGRIEFFERSGWIYLVGGISIILGICSLLLIVALFFDFDDGWNIKDCFNESICMFVSCEEQDGHYYYTLFGRLVLIRDRPIFTKLSDYISVDIINFSSYPKFKTIRQAREDKISKIHS